MAYMRMAKVLFLQRLLDEADIALDRKRIFDYGFGAGTFFHVCPLSASLFGVELDDVTVREVRSRLVAAGFKNVDLQPLQIDKWSQHPLLQAQYDVIVCSHVLEHLPDPVGFLTKMRGCLASGGSLLGLLPINERRMDPRHQWSVTRTMIENWATASGLQLLLLLEDDPWIYWCQPAFAYERGLMHKIAQVVSLTLGVPATLLGHKRWFQLGAVFRAMTFSRSMQAGFVLRTRDSDDHRRF